MADNEVTQSATPATLPSGMGIALRRSTYAGTASQAIAPVGIVEFAGADNAKTATDVPLGTMLGVVTETAPASDIASSGLNGRLQRIAQRISSFIALLPAALGASGGLKVHIAGDDIGSLLETDDGSVAAAQANWAACIAAGYTWNGSAWVRGGWTPSVTISAASTNATSVKASAGAVGFIAAGNVNAAARYLKLYNKASAPTVGTDTPVATFIIPGNTAGAGTNLSLPVGGLTFSTGIAFALTTGAPHTDTGAVALSEVQVNLGWL